MKKKLPIGFFEGLFSPLSSMSYALKNPVLWKWMLGPLLSSLALFTFFAWSWFGWLGGIDGICELSFGMDSSITNFMKDVGWLGGIISFIFFGIFSYFSFSTIGIIIAAPFCDVLSRKVLELEGAPVKELPLFKSIIRAIIDVAILSIFKIILLILSFFIPGSSLFLIFLFAGLDFFDYPWAHLGHGTAHKSKSFFRDILPFTGFSISFGFIFMIPFLIVLFCPLAVIASSRLSRKHDAGI